ncbi:MAG: hypothetical protein ACN4GR_07005 [Arenicellales bacterium]
MKLSDARDAYYVYSGNASTISRQASFAGIAIIWIFKNEVSGVFSLPDALLLPTLLLLLSLLFDLMQYSYASAAWGLYHRFKEKELGVNYTGEFSASEKINWPSLVFFWGKLIFLLIGYVLLVKHAVKLVGFIS